MTEPLKPCPFCGYDNPYQADGVVSCGACTAAIWTARGDWKRRVPFTPQQREVLEYLMNVPKKGQTIWSSDPAKITSDKAAATIRAMLEEGK